MPPRGPPVGGTGVRRPGGGGMGLPDWLSGRPGGGGMGLPDWLSGRGGAGAPAGGAGGALGADAVGAAGGMGVAGRSGAAGAGAGTALGACGAGVAGASATGASGAGGVGRGVGRGAAGAGWRVEVITRRGAAASEDASGAGAGAGAASTGASACFLAAVFLGAGSGSSGWTSRRRPSASALRRTRSAWASSIDEEWLFTPIPNAIERSSASLLVIPSSLASSWTRIFFANGSSVSFDPADAQPGVLSSHIA